MSDKIAVIGGGAAGMTAAISAALHGAERVTIYESGERLGRKILATGNGRCNMTNINADISNYHGRDPEFITGVKKRFWVSETLDFFRNLGILPKTESEGRVYPYSDQASAVLDVLRFKINSLGVQVINSFEVSDVRRNSAGFLIKSYDGRGEKANSVIIATGGKAAPNLGSKGGGYDILKSLGHTITPLYPSLVQIKTENDVVKKLKGIHLDAAVTLGGHSEFGEVLFTDYGLSGIAVFSMTSRLKNEKTLSLDIMSGYTEERLLEMLYMRIANNPEITLENFFVGMLNKRVGQAILKEAGIMPLSRVSVSLGEKELRRICRLMKNWEFKISGTMSWNNAQVTKGGARTDEFYSATMESKKISGLYAAGEILDIDGDCGGYNLQWAWSSGYLAGKSAALKGEVSV